VSRRVGYAHAASYIGVAVSTLYVLVHRRQIPHMRISKRLVVFDLNDLDRWLDERRQ
jgi:excisionase family DNA binding protein